MLITTSSLQPAKRARRGITSVPILHSSTSHHQGRSGVTVGQLTSLEELCDSIDKLEVKKIYCQAFTTSFIDIKYIRCAHVHMCTSVCMLLLIVKLLIDTASSGLILKLLCVHVGEPGNRTMQVE